MKKEKIFFTVDEILSSYSPEYAKQLQKKNLDLDKVDYKKTGVAIAKKLTLDFQNTISL